MIRLLRRATLPPARTVVTSAVRPALRRTVGQRTTAPSSPKMLRALERRDRDSTALAPAPAPTSPVSTALEPMPLSSIPVVVPHDAAGVLDNASGLHSDAARRLLSVSALVVARQIEMMNLFLGYEQANKYQLLSPEGTVLGFLMEEELGIASSIKRQLLKTRRAFKATVLDTEGNTILVIRRPFAFINSRITISSPGASGLETEEQVIGEGQQEWALIRRKMNHFVKRDGEFEQFGVTDSGFLAWDFDIKNEQGEVMGSINRNFGGFAKELFTDTGQYVLRFVPELPALPAPEADALLPAPSTSSLAPAPLDSSSSTPTTALANLHLPPVTLDQRAVMLASAVSLDFDYFSRSRGGLAGGGFMPLWMPMGMGGGGGEPAPSPDAGGEVGAANGEEANGGNPGLPSYGDSDAGGGGYGDSAPGSFEGGAGETMDDPWASEPSAGGGEDGGTWSWTDLFPDE